MSNDINALIRPKKELLDNLDKVALAKLEKEKKEYSNTIELYKRHQNNIKLSKGLLSEILQETEKGEDICNLFLKAVRYISRMPHLAAPSGEQDAPEDRCEFRGQLSCARSACI